MRTDSRGGITYSTAAIILIAIHAGCAAPLEQTGVRIGDETLSQFEAGVTTEAWLVAVLGEPSSESEVAGIPNTKVFRYALGQAAGGLGALLSGEAGKNTAVVYFIITDGVVTRFWADSAVERTILGGAVEAPSGEKQE
jgi:hypothetical protein